MTADKIDWRATLCVIIISELIALKSQPTLSQSEFREVNHNGVTSAARTTLYKGADSDLYVNSLYGTMISALLLNSMLYKETIDHSYYISRLF